MSVVRKPPSKQTYAEKLRNLKAARAAKKRKRSTQRKRKKPVRVRRTQAKGKPIVYIKKKPKGRKAYTRRRKPYVRLEPYFDIYRDFVQ